MPRNALAFALVAALAACTQNQPAPAGEDTGAATPGAVDQPSEDVPPATAPTPDADAGDAPDTQARFGGYGDIDFGTPEAGMEAAWGGELKVEGKEYNEQCFFMTPTWVDVPADLAFMIGDGQFVRYGTESERFVAPGGGRIGMTKAEVAANYAGIEEQPHKYTDGQYLRITDAASGNLLIFETDGKGDDAKVTEWRVGVEPYVGYVEGCA